MSAKTYLAGTPGSRLMPPATPRTPSSLHTSIDGPMGGPHHHLTEETQLVQEFIELSKFAHVYPFDKLDPRHRNMEALELCDLIPGLSQLLFKHYDGMAILSSGKFTHAGMEDEEDDYSDDEEEEEEEDQQPREEDSTAGKKRKRSVQDNDEQHTRSTAIYDPSSASSSSDTDSPTENEFHQGYGGLLDYDPKEECDKMVDCNKEAAQRCLPINLVLGLEDVKHLLINNITKPIVNPSAFRGTLPPHKFLAISGQQGSGVSTLVRAFCMAMGLRLYVVLSHLSVDLMMKTILNCSLDQDTVILFDRCDNFFAQGSPDSARGTEFKYHYEQYKLHQKRIWVIFSLTMSADHLQPWFRELTMHHRETANTPNQQARTLLLYRFIRHQYKKYTEEIPIRKKLFRQLVLHLVRCSHCYTPRALLEYVKAVFRRTMDKCPLTTFKSMGQNCEYILPGYKDFMSMIHGTSDDPQLAACGTFVRDQSLYYDAHTRHKIRHDPQFSRKKDHQEEEKKNHRHSHRFSTKIPEPKRRCTNPIVRQQQRHSLAKTLEPTRTVQTLVPKSAIKMTNIRRTPASEARTEVAVQ